MPLTKDDKGGADCQRAVVVALDMADAQRAIASLGQDVRQEPRVKQLCDKGLPALRWRGWCSECHWDGNKGRCADFLSERVLELAKLRESRNGATQVICVELGSPTCEEGAEEQFDDDSTFQ